MADPSFSQWIKEEVAVKLRILFESLVDEKIVPDLVTAFVMSPASGISPYVYWVRDHAVPSAAQIAPPPPSVAAQYVFVKPWWSRPRGTARSAWCSLDWFRLRDQRVPRRRGVGEAEHGVPPVWVSVEQGSERMGATMKEVEGTTQVLGLPYPDCKACGKPLSAASNFTLRLHRTCEEDLFSRFWVVE